VRQRRRLVWPFRLVRVVLVLVCSGCATAGLSTSEVEAIAQGNRVTLLIMGTGNKWAPRREPDLYMLVAARNPTPSEKVQIDLSECQGAARTVWTSDAAATDRTILAAQGPAYNPGAEVSKATMELLTKTYESCLQPKGYTASPPVPK
jgi:hypothetical protein